MNVRSSGPPDIDIEVEVEALAAARVFVVHVRGVLGLEALRGLGPALRARPDFDPAWGVIYDLSRADVERIPAEDLRDLVAELGATTPDRSYPVAHVVPSNLRPGFARVFAVLARLQDEDRSRPRHVARSLEEALGWMRGLLG